MKLTLNPPDAGCTREGEFLSIFRYRRLHHPSSSHPCPGLIGWRLALEPEPAGHGAARTGRKVSTRKTVIGGSRKAPMRRPSHRPGTTGHMPLHRARIGPPQPQKYSPSISSATFYISSLSQVAPSPDLPLRKHWALRVMTTLMPQVREI